MSIVPFLPNLNGGGTGGADVPVTYKFSIYRYAASSLLALLVGLAVGGGV